MMPHIYEFDWAATAGPRECTLGAAALDNCTIEKILQNRFHDPLISSEDDSDQSVIDWDEVLKNVKSHKEPKLFIPGLRQSLHHPKLSVLKKQQQFQGLKVICTRNPHVLPQEHLSGPISSDYDNFEKLQEVYENEQKEFIEWAKTLWTSMHCGRALRPKPIVETAYEAEFKVRAHRLNGFPIYFDMAAQIPLECMRGHQYNMELKKTLIAVNISELPEVQLPKQLDRSSNIIKQFTLPEPCHKHPYQFVLPNEDTVSMLPILEIHRELAQFAADNGTRFIASENALRCLVQYNRYWTLPVSVCQTITPDGERRNVVVLDSEFSIHKEPAMMRTYRAYKHLLENTFIPRERVIQKCQSVEETATTSQAGAVAGPPPSTAAASDVTSDDESEHLLVADDLSSEDEDAPAPRRSLRLSQKNKYLFEGQSSRSQNLPNKNKNKKNKPSFKVNKIKRSSLNVNKPSGSGLRKLIKPKQNIVNVPQFVESDLSSSDSGFKKLVICESNDEDDKLIQPKQNIVNVPQFVESDLSSSDSDFKKLVICESIDEDDKIICRAKCLIAQNVPLPKDSELSSDEEQMNLVINADDTDKANPIKKPQEKKNDKQNEMFGKSSSTAKKDVAIGAMSADVINDIIGVYSCTCTDTPYEVPARRSFVKWNINNCASNEHVDVIVHCAHKTRDKISAELILEPIPEYQLELGGCEQHPDRVRGVALALLLRQKASVLNVRLDGCNGDIVRMDKYHAEQFLKQHKEKQEQVVNVLHTALTELQELVPGQYVLKHEPAHGANALLYVFRNDADGLTLLCDSSRLAEPDEAKMLKAAPVMSNVLLPFHKHRKILPCAFTPYENMVIKEVKKPGAKQKPPPQAIRNPNGGPDVRNKWPKKKNKKGQQKQN